MTEAQQELTTTTTEEPKAVVVRSGIENSEFEAVAAFKLYQEAVAEASRSNAAARRIAAELRMHRVFIIELEHDPASEAETILRAKEEIPGLERKFELAKIEAMQLEGRVKPASVKQAQARQVADNLRNGEEALAYECKKTAQQINLDIAALLRAEGALEELQKHYAALTERYVWLTGSRDLATTPQVILQPTMRSSTTVASVGRAGRG